MSDSAAFSACVFFFPGSCHVLFEALSQSLLDAVSITMYNTYKAGVSVFQGVFLFSDTVFQYPGNN